MYGQSVLGFNSNVTFRDHIAIKAMAALIAVDREDIWSNNEIAKFSYEMADSLIMESNK